MKIIRNSYQECERNGNDFKKKIYQQILSCNEKYLKNLHNLYIISLYFKMK